MKLHALTSCCYNQTGLPFALLFLWKQPQYMNKQWLVLSLWPITLTFGVLCFKRHVSAAGWSTIQFQCPVWETDLLHRQKGATFNGTLSCWSVERLTWLISHTPVMLFLACDFMVQPNFPWEIRFKHHFSLNIQIHAADGTQIHLQVARQWKLLLKEPKHYDLRQGCFPRISEVVKIKNL